MQREHPYPPSARGSSGKIKAEAVSWIGMHRIRKLPTYLRPLLKACLGELIPSAAEAAGRLKQRPGVRVVSVGDVTTAELLKLGIEPDVAVVDYKIMRSKAGEEVKRVVDGYRIPSVRVRNPAGTITPALFKALEKDPPIKIIVKGEEDLATIAAAIKAPLGSVVVYGQPGKGVVWIDITEQKKRQFEDLLGRFE